MSVPSPFILHHIHIVATRSIAPYRKVITHGFVLDPQGRKMSKSLGNIMPPASITGENKGKTSGVTNLGYGVDAMRLWVASTDYTKDVAIGPAILSRQRQRGVCFYA